VITYRKNFILEGIVRKLVIIYFILINLTGFTLALLEGSDFLSERGKSLSSSSEIQIATVSAFGGGGGSYIGYLVSDPSGNLEDSEFKMYLQLLILQNIFVLFISFNAFKKKKKSADYNRSSLSLK
jgi:hypothetical protein